jgi:hypothetical protein
MSHTEFLIDADGVIDFCPLWASDRRALHQALESAANGEKPVRSESTALVGPLSRAMGRVQEVMERASARGRFADELT